MRIPQCLLIALLFIAASVAVNAQCPVMPQGLLCISQAAGNAARENALELAATKEKVTVLEQAVSDLKTLNATNLTESQKSINELKEQNTNLLVKVADSSGALGECRGDKVMYIGLIEYLTKNQKSKQNGAFNIKLGGN